MPSTPTPRLRVMQQARGENINAWGDPNLNNALARLEEGQAKVLTLVITGDKVLSVQNYLEDEARSAVLILTGTPSAAFKITIPSVEKPYLVDNRTGQICTIGSAAGVAATVRAGVQSAVFCNGADTSVIDPTLDKVRKATAPVDLNGQRLTNVAPAIIDSDAPNFGQINQAVTTATSAASTATSAASSATTSATAAIAARNGAEAAYDSFDDRYLGAKSAAPSTDNDGDPLLVGALYFNTTANEMRVWNGSIWQSQVPDAANFVPNTRQITGSNGITGGGSLSADRSFGLDYASQAEAEAGTISSKPMSPARTAQAIAAQTGLVLISSQTVSSAVASVDFTGLGNQYDEYVIDLQGFLPSAAAAFQVRTSANNGSSYDSGASDYAYGGVRSSSNANSVFGADAAAFMQITPNGEVDPNVSLGGLDAEIRIIRPSLANKYARIRWHASLWVSRPAVTTGSATRNVAASINALRLSFSTGTITAGTAKLYGLRKA